jgi:hypothetical protein
MEMKSLKKTLLLLFVAVLFSGSLAGELRKRRRFAIPLPLLTVLFDSDNKFVEAFVTYNNTSEGWAIGMEDDRYVKDTRRERVDHFYREKKTSAHYVTPFEAKVMEKVCKRFEETLVVYEKDLKHHRWDRLLYLDGYLPSFFRGFFYLYCGAHNSFSALPKVTRIADSLYDESILSRKSDMRITVWEDNPEHVVKLRIAAKELEFQLKQWRMRVLAIPEMDIMRQDKTKKLREAYELFIRLYFNLPPASVKRRKIF